jgi:ubiquinone/menaquinone biosynthesis C-methylase UbiE
MRRFWDRRAREDAFHFVDSRLPYRHADQERFWAEGEKDLATLLDIAGVTVEPGSRVLEIGCGLGRLTRGLAARAGQVVALDVSAEMLAQARRHNGELQNVTWLQGDGATLSGVDDESVDACISHVVFQHIPDPAVTLGYVAEMGRVLRPGGWAAFQVSNDPRVHRAAHHNSARHRLLRRVRAGAGRAPRGVDDPAWLGSAVDLGDLTEVAEDAGLKVEQVFGAGTQFCVIRARRTPA